MQWEVSLRSRVEGCLEDWMRYSQPSPIGRTGKSAWNNLSTCPKTAPCHWKQGPVDRNVDVDLHCWWLVGWSTMMQLEGLAWSDGVLLVGGTPLWCGVLLDVVV